MDWLNKPELPKKFFSDTRISGKVQISSQVAQIEKQDTINIITVISGGTKIIKVIAFDSNLENLKVGDQVLLFSKAFNPIICRLQ
jgi:molybdate transport system ATP-binding protein